MSELNLNAALSPELPGVAGIGPKVAARDTAGTTTRGTTSGPVRGTTGAAGATEPARPDGGSSADPFASLLAGILQGTQPVAPTVDPLITASPAPHAELPAAEPADPRRVVDLPASVGPASPPADASVAPGAGSNSGNVLPSTGRILPPRAPGIPGATTANPAEAANEPEPNHTGSLAATRAPAATRPGVSLADLAYARQLVDAPGLATASTTDAIRPAAALAFGGRSLAAARVAPVDLPDPPPALNSDLPRNLTPATGADPAPVATGTDGLTQRLSVGDWLRTTIIPGAGAELAGRQLAAFAGGDDRRAVLADSTAPAAASNGGSASLLRQLGTTALPGLQPLGDAGTFSAGLADRLLLLGGPGTHSARLKLYPEHLGELDVEISIEDGNARVWFGTTTGQARDAIEGSLPRLRELFAEQGIQLSRAEVDTGGGPMGHPGSEPQRRTAGDGFFQADSDRRPAARAAPVSGSGRPATAASTSRLLDVWA